MFYDNYTLPEFDQDKIDKYKRRRMSLGTTRIRIVGSAESASHYLAGLAGESKRGGVIEYDNDRLNSVTKDKVVRGLMPDTISECSLISSGRGACSSPATVSKIAEIISRPGLPVIGAAKDGVGQDDGPAGPKQSKEIIDKAKEQLQCNTEKCVLEKLEPKLGAETIKREMKNLKISGPTDIKLLSNYDIDKTLQIWRAKFPRFYAYNFNMLNYSSYRFRNGDVEPQPDTLETISWADDLADGYDTAGCVINTDTYQGSGKHWMALFADWRDKSRPTIEFFNSSGNAPASAWIKWMTRVKIEMEAKFGDDVPKIVRVTKIRQQQSRTECGVYSLFYIWSRLNKVPYSYFEDTPIPDQLMFEFRQHLFAGPLNSAGEATEDGIKFDFEKYRNRVNIKWE